MPSEAELRMRDYVGGKSAPPAPDWIGCWSGEESLRPTNVPRCGAPAPSAWQRAKDGLSRVLDRGKFGLFGDMATVLEASATGKVAADACTGWASSPLECIKSKGLNVLFIIGGVALIGAFAFQAIKSRD